MENLLDKALEIATKAHYGQRDLGGKDYIDHPKRVADNCNTEDEKIVAFLHDTIEDAHLTPQMLYNEGFSKKIVEAVLSVTRKKDETYNEYIMRAKNNPIGRVVKINDILDNLNISRLEEISDEDKRRVSKYIVSLRILIDFIAI